MCITLFDPTAHGHFDWVHASPPCQESSICMTGSPRRLEDADAISAAALRTIEHFAKNGTPCTLVNPWTGSLRKRPHMLPHADRMRVVNYCKYGHPFRKRTAVWTWNLCGVPRPLCKKDCDASDGDRQTASAQKGPDRRKGCPGGRDDNFQRTSNLITIPDELATELCMAAEGWV